MTLQIPSSSSLILSPAKNALGKLATKNIRNLKGCFSDRINAEGLASILIFQKLIHHIESMCIYVPMFLCGSKKIQDETFCIIILRPAFPAGPEIRLVS